MTNKNLCYDVAITKFLEEYLEMPKQWYSSTAKGRVLYSIYADVAISVLIAKEVFTLSEIKQEFYKEYKMLLKYNTEGF